MKYGNSMNILIISSSEGIFLTLARCLGINGHKVYGFSIWKTAGYASLSRFCEDSVEYPVLDVSQGMANEALDKINEYCLNFKIDFIAPAGLWGTYFLAKHSANFISPLTFPTPTAEQIVRCHNKWLFFLLLKELKVPTPHTVLLQSIDSNYADLNYPLVVKPISSGNSDGVQRCNSKTDLEEYLLDTGSISHGLLIQEFFEGFDAIFGFIANNGTIVAWTLHRKSVDFLGFFHDSRVLEIARKILNHVQYNGVGNFDLRYDESRDYFIFLELNPRFWASCGASKYFGVDFFEIGVCMVRQELPDTEMKKAVTKTQLVPYPSSWRFVKGLVTGKYKFSATRLTDLAWQTLLDPLPTLMEVVKRKQSASDIDDTFMIESSENYSALDVNYWPVLNKC
jgi:predicted ATP-grasp superfamily ATP-dependent carboligase